MLPKFSSFRWFCKSLHALRLQEQVKSLAAKGCLEEALSLLSDSAAAAPDGGPTIDVQTFAALFHSCARLNSLHHGIGFHRLLLLSQNSASLGLYPQHHRLFLTNHLINMYAKCGDLARARSLFDEMSSRNHVSWTALISGHAQHGRGDDCFLIFAAMLSHLRPNEFAFASVLSSCVDSGSGKQRGKQVHALALKISIDASVYVANALISMYSKARGCGAEEAWTVFRTMEFRNLITWNSMIAGFQLQGFGSLGIDLFLQMHQSGVGFDRATILSLLASLSSGTTEEGMDTVRFGFKCCCQFHCIAIRSGLTSEIEVVTALVKAYSDLGGNVAYCSRLFLETDFHSQRDIVLWTSIITATAEQEPGESLSLFRKLHQEGYVAPDRYAFSSILKACAGLVTEKHALSVHSLVIKYGLDGDTVVANSLIHAYARCTSLALARQVFEGMEMESRDLVSWNSMLKAHALHGQGQEVLQLFREMNVTPDSATFVALLSACSHAGLVEDGIKIFDMMSRDYGMIPQLDHYACMVDILGRAGRVLEAQKLINQMPMEPDSVVWSAYLSACRKHGEAQLATQAAARLKELDPVHSLGYVQISNIYCSGGRYSEAGLVRKEMNWSGVRKEPGLSWVEIGNQIHEFASGGYRHPQKEVIYGELQRFIGQLKELGYVPETSLALHDVEEEHKEEQLHYHSEKLALAFAIMMGEGRSPKAIKIMKNIRICVDCHNFMKLASGSLCKEIVVRDVNRFHHFKDQVCSCNNYW